MLDHHQIACVQLSEIRGIDYAVTHNEVPPTARDLPSLIKQWTFHPFIFRSKRFYTVLLWRRVLAFLVASQTLKILTFYSTQLPGPNYHCREGLKLATLSRLDSIIEVLLSNC